MAHTHVPKFGEWDSENVPYTAYFDNARQKGTGAKMINPNDPEENPEAFPSGMVSHENYGSDYVVQVPPLRVTSDKIIHVSKHNKEHTNREEAHIRCNTTNQNITLDQQSRKIKSSNSGSNSEKSSSDLSLVQPTHHRTRSSQKKNLREGSNSFSPSSPPARLRSGNHREDKHQVASVPKFGAWDETDPQSGEGFTVIFNKVKEEKQIGSTKLPTMPPDPTIYRHTNHGSSSPSSKSCCCLFSRSNK